jgi:hypothetical protein
LIDQLVHVGADMLPGIAFVADAPREEIDLAIALGDSPIAVTARCRIRLNADPWSGEIALESNPRRWEANWWPMGAMTAACLAATEAFKIAMRKLGDFARNRERMVSVFADTDELTSALPQRKRLMLPTSETLTASAAARSQMRSYTLSRAYRRPLAESG